LHIATHPFISHHSSWRSNTQLDQADTVDRQSVTATPAHDRCDGQPISKSQLNENKNTFSTNTEAPKLKALNFGFAIVSQ
tara:strand:- start:266 stop:505 length:240 start_codon:yes stop_codon:yes gene_type:complete